MLWFYYNIFAQIGYTLAAIGAEETSSKPKLCKFE